MSKAIQKFSRQREAIYKNLSSRYDHPTAEQIYLDVKSEIPSLSLGTVYRNLSQLCTDNRLQVFNCGGIEHFDANTDNHYHFFCESCRKLYDTNSDTFKFIDDESENLNVGQVRTHNLMFYGTCKNCL